jgi:GNAT superfamily N-acetyltransferase
MEILTAQKDNFVITTDKNQLNIHVIHDFLANHSTWSKNIPIEKVQISIDNSLNFGVFQDKEQIGYARVISDFATIAYLGDVFILPSYRGKGLSKWLMEQIMLHPNLQNLRRWILLTGNAHELYKQYGWTSLENPKNWMEIHNPNIYNL